MRTASQYIMTWVEIRPISGIITKKDMRALRLRSRSANGCGYEFFANPDNASRYIASIKGVNLGKQYEVRTFTDRQFSLMKNGKVPFTNQQDENAVIIGKSIKLGELKIGDKFSFRREENAMKGTFELVGINGMCEYKNECGGGFASKFIEVVKR